MMELIAKLQALEEKWCWSIGAGIISKYECNIWERAKWQDRGRIVIKTHGVSFEDAIQKALDIYAARSSCNSRV